MALRLLPIARPCRERFDTMTGDDARRFCESCDKHVHDLSAGTEEDALDVLRKNEGRRICVRFAKNPNGTVRFRAIAVAAAAAISVGACASHPADKPIEDPSSVDHDMGDMIPDAIDRCPDEPDVLPDGGRDMNDDDGCERPGAPDGGAQRP